MTAFENARYEVLRQRARSAVMVAKRAGELLPPVTCQHCGKVAKLHGHHPDYEKPLEVVWLCPKCHAAEHSRIRREAWSAIGGRYQRTKRRNGN